MIVNLIQIINLLFEQKSERNFGVAFFFYENLWNMALEFPDDRKTALSTLFNRPVERKSTACESIEGS